MKKAMDKNAPPPKGGSGGGRGGRGGRGGDGGGGWNSQGSSMGPQGGGWGNDTFTLNIQVTHLQIHDVISTFLCFQSKLMVFRLKQS